MDPTISAVRVKKVFNEEQEEDSTTAIEIVSPEEETFFEAAQIFASWDLNNSGHLSFKDILKLSNDDDFRVTFFQMLDCNKDGIVDFKDVKENVEILRGNDMRKKIMIIFQFLNAKKHETLDCAQVQNVLKVKDERVLELLGFIKQGHPVEGKRLSIDDLSNIFSNSKCGERAMEEFCSALVTLLSGKKDGTNSVKISNSTVSATQKNNTCYSAFTELWIVKKTKPFAFWIAVQVSLWIFFFLDYRRMEAPLPICIAKGFGLNIYVLTVCIFVTMAHSLKRYLYGIKQLQPFIPLESNIDLHSFLGFSILLHSVGHTAGQLVQAATRGIENTAYQASMLSGSRWGQSVSGDSITGYCLLAIMLAMSSTALLRSAGSLLYLVFRRCHFLYVPYLVLILLHAPFLWPWTIAISILFLLDALYMTLLCTTASTLRYSRTKSNVSYISVPKEANSPNPIPGSYYLIKIPAVSPLEWHPFSLAASVTSDHLTFMVDSVGDWTASVYELLQKDPAKRDGASVFVQGPYVSIAQHATKDLPNNRSVMLVASGVGITPFLSIIATKVTNQDSSDATKRVFAALFNETMHSKQPEMHTPYSFINAVRTLDIISSNSKSSDKSSGSYDGVEFNDPVDTTSPQGSTLHLVWSIRDCSQLLFYIEYLHHLVESQSRLSRKVVFIDVYLTGLGSSSDPSFLVSQTLFYLLVGDKAGDYLRIHYCRPNLDHIVSKVAPGAVYYCGGNSLKESTMVACKKQKVPFFAENADTGGYFTRMISNMVNKSNGTIDKVDISKVKEVGANDDHVSIKGLSPLEVCVKMTTEDR